MIACRFQSFGANLSILGFVVDSLGGSQVRILVCAPFRDDYPELFDVVIFLRALHL